MSNNYFFKSGFDAVGEEEKRQEARRANFGKKLWRLFLKNDGDEAGIRFLHNEPVNFQEHSFQEGGNWNNMLCTQDSKCAFCARNERPSFKSAFLVFDMRPYTYTNKQGESKTVNGSVRLFVAGTKLMSQVARLHSKYGDLTKLVFTLTRYGKGTSTNYTMQREDTVVPYTKGEIANMLPEKLRGDYDGSENSLLNIIQEQLLMTLPDYVPSAEVVDEESSELTEEEDTFVEDIEETPKKKSGIASKFRRK